MVLVMSSWGLIKRGLKVVVRDILVWGLGVCAVLEFMMSCLFSCNARDMPLSMIYGG